MNEYLPLPSLEILKQQAKRLRQQLNGSGSGSGSGTSGSGSGTSGSGNGNGNGSDQAISHSQALELLAHQFGYRDWNTLHAAAGNQPAGPPVILGARVSGHYLERPFVGEVVAVQSMSHRDQFRTTVNFDKPVDVVKFEGWSAHRKRVSSQIDRQGRSPQKTSNGVPLMVLDL